MYNTIYKISDVRKLIFYLYCFSINFEFWAPLPYISVSKFFGFLYIVSILPNLGFFLNIKPIKNIALPIIIYLGIQTFMSLININSYDRIFIDFSTISCFLIFIVSIKHCSIDSNLIENGLISFSIGALILAFSFFLDIGVQYYDGRVLIFGDNPNRVGIKISVSLIIITMLIIKKKRFTLLFRMFLIVLIPFMLFVIIKTGSRTSIGIIFLSILAGIIFYDSKYFIGKVLIITLGVILFYQFYNIILENESLVYRIEKTIKYQDLSGRKQLWEKSFELIKSNVLLGKGSTGYSEWMIRNFMFDQRGNPQVAHNAIIQILTYTGIVGLLFYSIFWARLFKLGIQDFIRKKNLTSLLFIIVILSMILVSHVLHAKTPWLLYSYLATTKLKLGSNKDKFE